MDIQTETLTKKQMRLKKMIEQINHIIDDVKKHEAGSSDMLEKVHPNYKKSACNLLHYQAFRKHDLKSLQKQLGYLGLSRLAKTQFHVMASLQTNRAILKAMLEGTPISKTTSELSFKKGQRKLNRNAKQLLGYRTKGRRTRIMVTMPSEAADNPKIALDMMKAGMNCARVNCAHDTPEVWGKIINNVRAASTQLGKKCKVAMDLAGPKIRTGAIIDGPKVKKLKPVKDIYGKIEKPLEIWLGRRPKEGLPHVPISRRDLGKLEGIDALYMKDTRGKKRSFKLVKKEEDGYLAHCFRTTFIESGLYLFFAKEKKGDFIEVGEIPAVQIPILLHKGDKLRLDKDPLVGENAMYNEHGKLLVEAHIYCTAPAIFDQVKVGEKILFDDGKIEGVIRKVKEDSLSIEITYAAIGGAKLRADKGINLPDTQLTIGGLTEKDKRDLPFITQHADVVNFSFVNRPEDVRELIAELEKLDAKDKLGVILKIETKSGYDQLMDILLEAVQIHPVGIMIARGDLAIESGWKNIGRIQEEILSICQSAHVTDIWATQVLEGLAKRGLPSRAEITDAVMAQRADCVMLNKGPYIVEAIGLLDSILSNMESFMEKNAPFSPKMEKTVS